MIKRFLKDSAIYSVSSLITRGISLLLVPFYTRVFTPGDYGIIDLLAIVGSIISMVVPLQITQSIARFYPDCKDRKESIEYASTGLIFTIFVFIIFLLIIIPFKWSFNQIVLNGEIPEKILIWALFSVSLQGLFYYAQNLLRWKLEPKKFAISSIVYSLASIGFTVVFVLFFESGVIGVFWAQCLGGGIGFLLSFYLAKDSYKFFFKWDILKKMLIFSAPLIPAGIAVFVLTYADRIMISKFMTLKDLGLFGIGYRISSVVGIVMVGVQGSITPLIYNNYKDKNTPDEIEKILRYFIVFAILVTAVISIFAHEVLVILTTPQYYNAAVVIPFLVMASFLSGMYVFAPGLAIEKKTKTMALISFVGAIINILLNFVLIRLLGIMGAAISTALSGLLIFAVNMYYSQKYYYVNHNFMKIILAFGSLITFVLLSMYIQGNTFITSIIIKSSFMILLLMSLFMLGLIRKDELKKILNKVNISSLLLTKK